MRRFGGPRPGGLSAAGGAFVVGGLVGLASSVATNATLLRVSLSPTVALLLGLFLVLVGAALILWRMFLAAGLLLLAGANSVAIGERWLVTASATAKVLPYAVLGTAVCFLFCFSVVDLLNSVARAWSPQSRYVIQLKEQVYLVAATACAMGMIFGVVFGLMDVEDQPAPKMRDLLSEEERLCYPVGVLLGGVAAVIARRMRDTADNEEYGFDPGYDDELEQDY